MHEPGSGQGREGFERVKQLSLTLAFTVAIAISLGGCQGKNKVPDAVTPEPPMAPASSAKPPPQLATPVPTATPAPTPYATPSHSSLSEPGPLLLAAAGAFKQLTTVGDNSEARFSPDGKRILFVSRTRPSHRQAQIYELDLATMKEHRVTFHDGDDRSPAYIGDGKRIVYASETDEIKEESVAMKRLMKTYYPEGLKGATDNVTEMTELYSQTLAGRELERLTKSPGFDGDPEPEPKGRKIFFVSSRAHGHPCLYSTSSSKKADIRKLGDCKARDRWPRLSPDGKQLAWSRQENETSPALITVASSSAPGKKPRELTGGKGKFLDLQPVWHPSGKELLFTSNREGKSFNLYSIDAAGKCLKRLTNVGFDLLHPALSPDGKQIVFSAQAGSGGGKLGVNPIMQVFMMDYAPPSECLAADFTGPPAAP
jgi:Tol biopolymer transport system component